MPKESGKLRYWIESWMRLAAALFGERIMARVYGNWAGNEKGNPEDKTRCVEKVWPITGGWIPHQCRRKRGYGKDGLYCKQHAKNKP